MPSKRVVSKNKEDQQIIVVGKDALFDFQNDYFSGFRPAAQVNYESRILDNLKIMRRGDAEIDSSHKQPIGYGILFNPDTKQIFTYQRSDKETEKGEFESGELRLHGKWSWGFGGHIEADEAKGENPIKESLVREVLGEEIEICGKVNSLNAIGYVNDDSDEVGMVHFGVLYAIETDATKVEPKDPEIAIIEPRTISELEELCNHPDVDVESWSKIAFDPLSKIILK